MKIQSKAFFLLIFTLFTSYLHSQVEFKQGFIIPTPNDTLFGFIKESVKSKDIDLVYIPELGSEEEKVFRPMMVKEYFLAPYSLYETHLYEYFENTIPVYFQVLLRGKVTLYSFIDTKLVEHFFLKSEELGMRELLVTEKERYDEETKKRYRVSINSFQGEMKLAMKDCPSIFPIIDGTSFNQADLLKCVKKYHECVGEDFTDYSQKPKEKFTSEFGLRVGTNTLKRIGERGDLIPTTAVERTEFGQQIGAFVYLYIPKSKKRFAVELGYNYYQIRPVDPNTQEAYTINRHGIPIKLNNFFSRNNSRIISKLGLELNAAEPVRLPLSFGFGYDYDLKAVRLALNADVVFDKYLLIAFNLGASF